MIEAYKIGVSINLEGNINKAVTALVEQFERLQGAVTKIQEQAGAMTADMVRLAAAGRDAASAWQAAANAMARAARAGNGPGPRVTPPPPTDSAPYPYGRMPGDAGGALVPYGTGGPRQTPIPLLLMPPGGGLTLPPGPYGAGNWGAGGGPPGGGFGPPGPPGGAGGPPGGPMVPHGGIPLNYQPPPPPTPPQPNIPGFNGGAAFNLMTRATTAVYVVDMVVEGISHLIDKAKGLNDALVALQQRGVSPAQTASFEQLAYKIGAETPNRSYTDIIADAGNLRAVLGEKMGSEDPLSDVKTVLPAIEKMAAALSSMPNMGMDADAAMHALMRAIELRGGLIDPKTHKISSEKFSGELDAIYKVLIAGGGMIKPGDLLQLMQQAGPMARMFEDPKDFYNMMMTAVLDMKGNRAGTALTAAGRQVFGGRMSKIFADEMGKLGIIDQGDYKSYGGGYIELGEKSQKMLDAAMTSANGGLFGFIEKIVKPALEGHGFDTDEKKNEELYKIISTETFRRLAALFLQNADQVLRDQNLLKEVPAAGKALDLAKQGSIGFNMDAMTTSFSNLMNVMEKANAGKIIEVLHALQALFEWLDTAEQNKAKMDEDAGKALSGPRAFWHYSPLDRRFWDPNAPDPQGEQGGPGHEDRGDIHKESFNQPLPLKLDQTMKVTLDGTVPIQMDGRTVAMLVADRLAAHGSLPQSGPSGVDTTMGPINQGMQIRV